MGRERTAPRRWPSIAAWLAVFGVLVIAIGYVLLYVGGALTVYRAPLPPERGAPNVVPPTAIDLGPCGTVLFSLDVPAGTFAGEPFAASLRASRAGRAAAGGESPAPTDSNSPAPTDSNSPAPTGGESRAPAGGPACRFTANLAAIGTAEVAVAPAATVPLLLARGAASTRRDWRLRPSSAGPLDLVVTIAGGDVATASVLDRTVEVLSSRRLSAANRWLTGVVGGDDLTIQAVATDLRKGRRGLVTVVVAAPTGVLPPGLSPTATLEVCLEATGGGASSRHCSTANVDLGAPLRVERLLPLDVVSTDRITIAAELRLTGVVDGEPTGASVRSTAVAVPVRAEETWADKVRDAGRLALNVVGVMGGAAGLALVLAGGRQVLAWWRRRRAVPAPDGPPAGYL